MEPESEVKTVETAPARDHDGGVQSSSEDEDDEDFVEERRVDKLDGHAHIVADSVDSPQINAAMKLPAKKLPTIPQINAAMHFLQRLKVSAFEAWVECVRTKQQQPAISQINAAMHFLQRLKVLAFEAWVECVRTKLQQKPAIWEAIWVNGESPKF